MRGGAICFFDLSLFFEFFLNCNLKYPHELKMFDCWRRRKVNLRVNFLVQCTYSKLKLNLSLRLN